MPALLSVLAHHAEPTDPALLEALLDWLQHTLGPAWPVLLGLGALALVALPLALVLLARRARSRLGR